MEIDENVTDEGTKLPEPILNDLRVSDEQAEQATGGALSNGHGTHVAGTIGASPTADQQGRLLIGTEGGIWRG